MTFFTTAEQDDPHKNVAAYMKSIVVELKQRILRENERLNRC